MTSARRPIVRLGAYVALAALALSMASGAPGRAADNGNARFSLFANCAPMNLVVDVSLKGAEVDLSESSVQAAAESRLRSARLYDADALFHLFVGVVTAGHAYGISLEYYKYVNDISSDSYGYATTWASTSVGTHGGNPGYILGNISKYMDEFLVEFLRVNEEAC